MDIHERIALLKAEIEVLSAILDADGLMVVGSTGQPRVHPAVAERHAAIALLHRLESRIDPDKGPSALDDFLGGTV